MDFITAQLATIPDREDFLKQVVNSLIDQVDLLSISLNNYKKVPEWLRVLPVETRLLDNSTGDAAKFYGIEDIGGYFFACDDDLIYPKDYIETLIDKIEQYQRRAIITLHGRVMPQRKVVSYYKDRFEIYRCLGTGDYDVRVHVGGTGVMGFHSDTFKIKYSDFKEKNMADIWVSGHAKRQNVPIVVIAHKAGWLVPLIPTNTIWDQHYEDDELQTNIYNDLYNYPI